MIIVAKQFHKDLKDKLAPELIKLDNYFICMFDSVFVTKKKNVVDEEHPSGCSPLGK